MNLDPYTASVIMRALGLRKVSIHMAHALRASPHDEIEQFLSEPGRTIELRLLEPVIEGEAPA